ncbi:hypothetical protein LTR36_008675 [Oleoguttula mirabilis]|uniref:Ig-like domain-containing protein n=1 Tax=Oleoguttula mirabilis TaxID=1507867 RepID=A0AAV9JV91_9PEZI|nr:hypothetical protein LTR36_008675 [Oleoguttula mirabilis]
MFSRASCTDESWADSSCGKYCLDSADQGGGQYITACVAGGPFTCGLNTTLCMDDTDTFDIVGDTTIRLRDFQLGQAQTAAVELSPNANYTCDALAGNATASSTAETQTVTVSAGTQTVTVTAYAQSGIFTASSRSGFSTADIAGATVGTGAPLLLALAAAVFLIFRLRKKVREAEGWQRNGDNVALTSYYADAVRHSVAAPKQEEAITLASELDSHPEIAELDARK